MAVKGDDACSEWICHQKLWAAREAKNGDWIPGFCISEANEEICSVGFAEGLMKTHKSEGRVKLLDGFVLRWLWLLMATRQCQ